MRKIQIKLNIVKEVTVRTAGDVRTSRGYEYGCIPHLTRQGLRDMNGHTSLRCMRRRRPETMKTSLFTVNMSDQLPLRECLGQAPPIAPIFKRAWSSHELTRGRESSQRRCLLARSFSVNLPCLAIQSPGQDIGHGVKQKEEKGNIHVLEQSLTKDGR